MARHYILWLQVINFEGEREEKNCGDYFADQVGKSVETLNTV